MDNYVNRRALVASNDRRFQRLSAYAHSGMNSLPAYGRAHYSTTLALIIIAGVVLAGFGWAFIVRPHANFARGRDALARYVPVSALMVHISPETKYIGADTSEYDLVYRYEFEGRVYESSAATYGRGASPATAARLASELPAGRTFIAFVDPAQPSESVISPHLTTGTLVEPILLGGLLCLAAFLVSNATKRRWRKPARCIESPLAIRLTGNYSAPWAAFVSTAILGCLLEPVIRYSVEVDNEAALGWAVGVAVVFTSVVAPIMFVSTLKRSHARRFFLVVDPTPAGARLSVASRGATSDVVCVQLESHLAVIKGSTDPFVADYTNQWELVAKVHETLNDIRWRPCTAPKMSTLSHSGDGLTVEFPSELLPSADEPFSSRRQLISWKCVVKIERSIFLRKLQLECLIPPEVVPRIRHETK